ncbi:MAG: prepilin-type N-terminal cleavage/methylation domain-containing protein [Gammaproteobacteria bacterium]|nr:prepilin-type N-terminal cleavage/methylation domain-containing protein [Gammaproteobacteria bacterium]
MNGYKKQTGFTLVELIVVIIILGILSATALPKFLDVTEKAHYSAVAGAAGGLGAGVALFHAQWVANGHTGIEANVQGFGASDVDSNANGWPVDVAGDTADNTPSDANCIEIWTGLMQNPPLATTGGGGGGDYQVTSPGNTCLFTYRKDTTNTRTITYNVLTGAVTTTNPDP